MFWKEGVEKPSFLWGDMGHTHASVLPAQAVEAVWQVLPYMAWGGAALSTGLK